MEQERLTHTLDYLGLIVEWLIIHDSYYVIGKLGKQHECNWQEYEDYHRDGIGVSCHSLIGRFYRIVKGPLLTNFLYNALEVSAGRYEKVGEDSCLNDAKGTLYY